MRFADDLNFASQRSLYERVLYTPIMLRLLFIPPAFSERQPILMSGHDIPLWPWRLQR